MDSDDIIAALPASVQRDLVALRLAAEGEDCVFDACVAHLAAGTPTWPTITDAERTYARTLTLFVLEDIRRIAGHLHLPALRAALARSIRRSRVGSAMQPGDGHALP